MTTSPAPFVFFAAAGPAALFADGTPVDNGAWYVVAISAVSNIFAGLFVWLKGRDEKKYDLKFAVQAAQIEQAKEAARAADARALLIEEKAKVVEARAEDVARKLHDERKKRHGLMAKLELGIEEIDGKVVQVDQKVDSNTVRLDDHSKVHEKIHDVVPFDRRVKEVEGEHPKRRETDSDHET